MTVNTFIEHLQEHKNNQTVFNPYSMSVFVENLRIYIARMQELCPDTVLVGEAPGYKGCAKCGIPFTSQYLMVNGNNEILGHQHGYKLPPGDIEKPYKENTATIVWSALQKTNPKPLLWNIFPFHPHRMDNANTNRAPSAEEQERGFWYLDSFISLFPSVNSVIAVGNKAHTSLIRHKKTCIKVRHPSFGGANSFKNGLESAI